jgi:hypothetical protein
MLDHRPFQNSAGATHVFSNYDDFESFLAALATVE